MRFRFRLKRIILSVLGVLIGPWLGLGAWNSLEEELTLRTNGIPTMATVREWRIFKGRYETSYEVRYAFKVAGRPEEFTHRDLFPCEREDLWESVPQPVWEESQRTQKVEVIYLADDPWINRPAAPEGNRRADRITGMVVGAGWGIAGAVGLAVGFWQYRRFRASPNGRRQFWLFWVED
jgi:hypothetical protein